MELKTAAGPPSTKREPRGNCRAAEQRAISGPPHSTRQADSDAPARILARPCNNADVIAAFRARANQLDVPRLEIDRVAGLARGHSSKLLCALKGFGPTSFWAMLQAMGMAVLLIEDPEATKQFSDNMSKRRRPPNGRPRR
jgi:hypothetical protein